MSYLPGDKIFAKVKGHPHWPCRINVLPPEVRVPNGKFPIFFYGTHEVYFLGPKDIFPYEKFKHKYGINRNKPAFQAGLREIEENPDILLYGKDPDAEAFLARFYKFTPGLPSGASVATQNGKRPRASPHLDNERPAKRVHTEKPVPAPRVVSSSDSKMSYSKPAKASPCVTLRKPITQQVHTPATTVGNTNETHTPSQRVTSLRLRIRKGKDGLNVSSAPTPPPSDLSPVSGSFAEVSTPSINDPLRITIKQLPSTCTTAGNHADSRAAPVFSVTTTTVTPAPPTTLMGVGVKYPPSSCNKSTAVVTPLRRDEAPPCPKDENVSLSASSDDYEDTRSTDLKRTGTHPLKQLEPHVLRRAHRQRTTGKGKEVEIPKASPSDDTACQKALCTSSDATKTDEPARISPKRTSPVLPRAGRTPTDLPSPTIPTAVPSEVCPTEPKQQQEQQLRDLDTEARLLLIDRSIKSSLVRDHEDIATCVDRLEMLDRISITLPVLAKCWTVVQTIGKCRRYKRSMEVKIAAQRVFNKFLQLYATSDKTELDLALAELMRHQQRHIKQHAHVKTDIPPYTGPKSMSELFQVSAGVLAERRSIGLGTSHQPGIQSPLSTSPAVSEKLPKSVDVPTLPTHQTSYQTILDRVTNSERTISGLSLPSSLSVRDIPLPEEVPAAVSKSLINQAPPAALPTNVSTEEEYEVLDEYEATSENNLSFGQLDLLPPSSAASTTSNQRAPTSMVETQIIPYDMVPAHMLPGPDGSLPPAFRSSNPSFPPNSTAVPSSSHMCTLPSVYPSSYLSSSAPRPQSYTAPPNSSSTGAPFPQRTTSVYIPHGLHNDPPSLYKPYAQSRSDVSQVSPKRPEPLPLDADCRARPSSLAHPVPLSATHSTPPSSSASFYSRSDVDDRRSRGHNSQRPDSSPHRTRSPHALPHPLEHYQRCLASALGSDEDEDNAKRPRHNPQDSRKHSNLTYGRVGSTAEYHRRSFLDSRRPFDPRYDKSSSSTRKNSEDLDSRIARIIGTVGGARPKHSEDQHGSVSKSSAHPLGSPPPPPPPLPASQHILFTHRPQHSRFDFTRTRVSGSAAPATPDSPPPRRSSANITRLESLMHSRANSTHPSTTLPRRSVARSHFSGSLPKESPRRKPDDTVHVTQNDHRVNREEDRDLYSMLGV